MNNKTKTAMLSSLLFAGGVAFAGIAGGGYLPESTPAMPTKAVPMQVAQAAQTEYAPIRIPATPQVGAPRVGTSAATPPSAAVSPTVQRMLLTAKSGEEVTLKQTMQMNMRITDMQVTGEMAKDGEMSAADLEEMNAMFADMGEMMEGGETTIRIGEIFADGSRELVSSSAAPMPDGSEYTIHVIQRIMPDGTVISSRIESDNADVQAMLDSMDMDELSKNGGLNGGTDTTVYGMALRQGETKTSTQTVDMESLVGGMFAAGMSLAAQEVPEDEQAEFAAVMSQLQVEAEPMTVRTTTTYDGLSNEGLPTFSSRAETDDWKMDINMPETEGVQMNMSVEMLGMNANSLSRYAMNGLPMYSKSTTDMTMKMTMDMGEMGSMSMTMQMSPVVTLEAVR